VLKGRRVVQSVPEARTQAQAERAESQLREDIYNRRYGQGKTMGLSDVFDNNYLSWLKENRSASAYRDALSRGKELKAFFKNQPVREISTRDCERFKSMLGKAETLRNELRSGSTVNRYMALLSGVCKRAIKEELLDANPCSKIDEEPENCTWRKRGDTAQLVDSLEVGHLNFSSRPVFYPRTFATRLRANGVHEYDISDLLGHSRPGATQVYARATRTGLEQAVEKLTEPWDQVIEFERRAG
jgi:integrase